MLCGCNGGILEDRQKAVVNPHDESTVEGLLLMLWAERDEKGSMAAIAEKLIAIAPDQLDEVELYLPQFAHIVANLSDMFSAADINELERFLLSVTQLSIHIALQLFWIFFALLQENRPKRKGNAVIYRRCARLLLQLEQCIVYGAYNSNSELSEKTTGLMRECVQVAVEAQTSRAYGQVVYSGWLLKKGSGRTSATRQWHKRFFQVKNRVLYYYTTEDLAAQDHPKGAMSLSDARVQTPPNKAHMYYFELHDNLSGLVLHLRAQNAADMALWLRVLQASSALPAPPNLATKEQIDFIKKLPEPMGSYRSDLVKKLAVFFRSREGQDGRDRGDAQPQSAMSHTRVDSEVTLDDVQLEQSETASDDPVSAMVYKVFNAQRDFIRGLTNLAEELRQHEPDARPALLQQGIAAIPIETTTFFPLGKSTSELLRVLRFPVAESIVINTKARCPLLLYVEVLKTSRTISDVIGYVTSSANEPLNIPTPTEEQASHPHQTLRKRELWSLKQERIRAGSELGAMPGWSLTSMIVKSNDDLRQEVFVMQILNFLKKIFPPNLTWLNCYEIQATGPDTGLIETITSAQDLDNLKKTPGYTTLRQLFISRYGPAESDGFKAAQDNFVKSLAAYSVVMWVLQLRDRHNGNLMLDNDGHFFHIDFGFLLGHSTGKQIGGLVESSPFKLTAEYLELLDGVDSPVYAKFCDACAKSMTACRLHGETICTMIEIVGTRSVFPCFHVFSLNHIIRALRRRLFMHLEVEEVDAEYRKVVKLATCHWGSRWYDKFQNMQRGIAI